MILFPREDNVSLTPFGGCEKLYCKLSRYLYAQNTFELVATSV